MAEHAVETGPRYHTVTPYLVVPGVAKLIDFVAQAFDATEIFKSSRPDGSIMHAEMKIGDSIVMMGEPPGESTPMPGMLYLSVQDTDVTYQRALDAGAISIRPPQDESYGHRMAGVADPCGNQWWIAAPLKNA